MKTISQQQLLALLLILIVSVLPYGCKDDDDMMTIDDDDMPEDTTDTMNLCALTLPVTQTSPWPAWVFYHWVWEDESTQQSAEALVDDYIAHDIPVKAIIIDSPWETGYNTFDWDASLYPDAQGMIDNFHSKDVRVIVWITSAINKEATSLGLYNLAADSGYFLYDDATYTTVDEINWWKGKGALIDFFNPDAVNWWKGKMDKLLDMGIDGWKCDGTDFYATGYSKTLGRQVTRNEYSDAYYRLHYDYSRQKLGNDRMITSRPVDNYGFDVGTDFVQFTKRDMLWSGWVGDQDATFEGLTWALNNMYHSDKAGYLAYGSDIGGYREESIPNGRTKELFLRWAQLGAMCPIMENGGSGEHRPWKFDNETTDIYRKFVKLHHELVPYILQEADHFWQQQESIMSFFNKTDYSYMFGRDIFVAPFIESGTNIMVNFPSGGPWVYAFDTTQVYQGGTTETLTIPLEDYPVFIDQNSTLMDCVSFGDL